MDVVIPVVNSRRAVVTWSFTSRHHSRSDHRKSESGRGHTDGKGPNDCCLLEFLTTSKVRLGPAI